MMRDVHVYADADALARAAADRIIAAARAAVAAKGWFSLALGGGRTPRGTYVRVARSARASIDWPAVHVFWSDERCVPPDHAESNYAAAHGTLLHHVGVRPERVHRIRGELGPADAAADYDARLSAFLGAPSPAALHARGRAGLDLVMLGVGADAHTASLFPSSPALLASGWATAAVAPPGASVRDRVSLTLAAIGMARVALVLVAGKDKAAAVVASLRAHPDDPDAPPAARVRALDHTIWLLDAAAAGTAAPRRA